jgi:hypothetical protein
VRETHPVIAQPRAGPVCPTALARVARHRGLCICACKCVTSLLV